MKNAGIEEKQSLELLTRLLRGLKNACKFLNSNKAGFLAADQSDLRLFIIWKKKKIRYI